MTASVSTETQKPAFTLPVRIYFEDTDVGGVVYYANYLKFMERCRTESLRSVGIDQSEQLRESGLAFVVRSVAVEYLKPARLDDLVEVDMFVEKIARAQIFFYQRIRRRHANGWDELARGKIQVVCVQAEKMKLSSIPDALRQKMESLQ